MSSAQKFLSGIIAIGVITAMALPGRQTVPVLGGIANLISGTEGTAIKG